MSKGLFIVMEGIDGSGKSTQVEMLSSRLQGEGRDVLVTREPGGTRIGSRVREMLLDPENKDMNYKTEAFLYAADRAQHTGEKIYPALEAGRTVVCDRFIYSTLAYQGGGRGIDAGFLEKINELSTSGLKPDLVFIIDVPPETGVQRSRGDNAPDRLEGEDLEFYNRVREEFLRIGRESPERCRIIDGSLGREEVHKQVWEIVKGRLAR